MDDAPVVKATGKSLGDWFAILDQRGARDLPHKDIARLLGSDYGVSGWWSQSVAVEYEKHIGRRETGQRQDGEYEGTATRTFPGTMDDVLGRWTAHLPHDLATLNFDGVALAGDPSVSKTDKWRYWRASLADGSRVTVTVSDKPAGPAEEPRATLAVTSSKLQTRGDSDRWKAYWRAHLADL